MSYCVYKHTFPNGKVYIGITCQKPEIRWDFGWGYRAQPFVFNAIRKYGWGNIKHEILYDGLTKEKAEQTEVELISKYKANIKWFGYNIANGGSAGVPLSEETKRKIGEGNKGKFVSEETRKKISKIRKGKTASEETKKKLSESHKGIKRSKESIEKTASARRGTHLSDSHKENISNALKGKYVGEKNHNYGKHFSEEHKRKISEAQKGEKNHMYGKHLPEETRKKMSEAQKRKRVRCIETDTIFCSVREAARQNNIPNASISYVCNGKRKTAGGYHWEFVEELT